MNETLERLRAAAEHALDKEKASEHGLRVNLEILRYGVLVRAEMKSHFRMTETTKLINWEPIEHAHVNVIIKAINESVAMMSGDIK